MGFNTWHAIANILNFILFVIIIAKYAGPAIQRSLKDREEATKAAIREAENARKAAEQALSATQARLAGVDKELADLVAGARDLAAKQAASLEATGREDAERLRVAARAEIERERQSAVNDIRRLLMQQAFERAARELQGAMTVERQRELVGGLIQKVGDGSLALK